MTSMQMQLYTKSELDFQSAGPIGEVSGVLRAMAQPTLTKLVNL